VGKDVKCNKTPSCISIFEHHQKKALSFGMGPFYMQKTGKWAINKPINRVFRLSRGPKSLYYKELGGFYMDFSKTGLKWAKKGLF
jgi:hypothetical protein